MVDGSCKNGGQGMMEADANVGWVGLDEAW